MNYSINFVRDVTSLSGALASVRKSILNIVTVVQGKPQADCFICINFSELEPLFNGFFLSKFFFLNYAFLKFLGYYMYV